MAFFRGRFSGRALPGWLIWVALLPVGMLAAYTGTILPDDLLSGGSLSVITGVLLSVPGIGTHRGSSTSSTATACRTLARRHRRTRGSTSRPAFLAGGK